MKDSFLPTVKILLSSCETILKPDLNLTLPAREAICHQGTPGDFFFLPPFQNCLLNQPLSEPKKVVSYGNYAGQPDHSVTIVCATSEGSD